MAYYWPTMITDCMEFARKCHICQLHGETLHQPQNTLASWPFAAWGTDKLRPIDPPSSAGHKAATDSFSRWAEAVPLREVKAITVNKFFLNNINYRFGVPIRSPPTTGSPSRTPRCGSSPISLIFTGSTPPYTTRDPMDWRKRSTKPYLSNLLSKVVSKGKRDWHWF